MNRRKLLGKRRAFMLSVIMLLSLCGCAGGASAQPSVSSSEVTEQQPVTGQPADVIRIKIAHASGETSTTQLVCEKFKKKAVELLGPDKVEISIYPNATLGSEAEMVEAIQMGTLETATFGRHSAIDSRLDVLNLPFLFEDDAHAEKVLRGSEGAEVREKLNAILSEHDIIALGWYETGFREITSNRPLKKSTDLAGLLIRTPSTETLKKSFEVWGASPTAIDLSELYTALQSKVVDAQENPYQLIYTNSFFEVQDYLCVTNHLTIPNQLVFSQKIWDTYPEDVKAALSEAGEYACNAGGEYNVEQNNHLLDELSQKMTVTYMDDESIAWMRDVAMAEVWPAFVSGDNGTEELVNLILSVK